jgi:hypothetical protein
VFTVLYLEIGIGEILGDFPKMDRSLRSLLGMLDDNKRIYQFAQTEVTREEFAYCQLIDKLVFGEKGYVETLGPTWNLVNDPRFMVIESAFIVNRRAVFGGDAKVGKQYISSDGQFTSTVADLEEYAEVLGEGRHFYNVLVHPNAECPTRKWLERIHTTTDYKAGELTCICDFTVSDANGNVYKAGQIEPHVLKDEPDEVLRALIKQECPNYFNQQGEPNGIAKRLFDLMRADLVGLVADYAVTPLIDEWILLDTGDVIEQTNNEDLFNSPPRVFAEIDILEKALTYRATLRATAAKVLRSLDFHRVLKSYGGEKFKLTDMERDQLLRLVYESDYPDDKAGLVSNLTMFIFTAAKRPYEERLKEQLSGARQRSDETVRGLLSGSIQPINQFTEPTVEVEQDEFAQIMESILHNPLKQQLFLIYVEAERRGESGKTDDDKLKMRKLASMLSPVFSSADYELTEEAFSQLIEAAKELNYYGKNVTQVEGEYGNE